MKPETSVIIPVRNGARFVGEALASVLGQLRDGDEVMVIDDGSTDETPVILAGLGHPALRLLSGGGRGVSAARNIGLASSRGAFIAFLDHDDIWPAGRHGALTTALKRDQDLDAAFGRIERRIEPGARITAESKVQGHHAPWLIGSGLFRRRLLERIGGFAEDMQQGEDLDFHQRLVEAEMRVRLCEIPGLVRRHHDTNTTNDQTMAEPWRLDVLRRKLARAKASPAADQPDANRPAAKQPSD
jgi:glycosyltransferase involved in cell wall biosynthesis